MAPSSTTDPLAPLVSLPGVGDAVARVRDALVAVHNHPANRRGFAANAAEGGLRGARASAAIDGAPLTTADLVSDPLLAGAARVADEHARLVPVWKAAPLQALARLHVLAAADLVPVEQHDAELGRPRPGTSDRLALLADLVTGATRVPAPVLVAVVHGEILALTPFGVADGVVARAAARLAATASGLDVKSLAVPEVGHLRRLAEYRTAAAAFAAGGADGVGAWLLHCCEQWEAGAREATSIAESR
ncbi:oxidoreductase [Pseudonocardia sp. N23]|uniref:oxidoreductase n=1 Tax=Pseudonocardia sp. N23 TaxID=1987376 RepID=UPI000BFB50F3|nr:oxidoreductase [Pseudonocardia sp. N23]GAY09293.1 probable oxidoreductase [Pseudonocardia sp. N23]